MMRRINIFTLIFTLIFSIKAWGAMKNEYYTWDDFVNNFDKEMVASKQVHDEMVKSGLKDFTYCRFDFHFVSSQKPKLEKLSEFLKSRYAYQLTGIKRDGALWELSGTSAEIPVTRDILMYWVLDMAKRGYEFDSRLDGYGALVDSKNPTKPDFSKSKEDFYFEKGVDAYNAGNLNDAIINWTIVTEINPTDPNAYYSRAIIKNELHTWKAAMRDYDKAIELAPDFISALINRGSLKDGNGDYEGAIQDYNLVIKLSTKDIEGKKMAYFNRGNVKFNLKDEKSACEDWRKASELGDEQALERLKQYCK